MGKIRYQNFSFFYNFVWFLYFPQNSLERIWRHRQNIKSVGKHYIISSSRYQQTWLMRLRFERYLSHCRATINYYIAHINIKKICGPGQNNRTCGPGQKEFEQCGWLKSLDSKALRTQNWWVCVSFISQNLQIRHR